MKRLLIIISILLTLPVLINTIWWIFCAVTFEGRENILNNYFSVFPEFMANVRTITAIKLLFGGINLSILIYFIKKKYYPIVSVVLLSINGLIFAWTLFSLM